MYVEEWFGVGYFFLVFFPCEGGVSYGSAPDIFVGMHGIVAWEGRYSMVWQWLEYHCMMTTFLSVGSSVVM